jgi:hypothetical protein
MAPVSRYAALRRSQLVIRLWTLERELLATDGRGRPRIRFGSKRDTELRKERAALFDALRVKDDEILAKWRAGWTYGGRARADTMVKGD